MYNYDSFYFSKVLDAPPTLYAIMESIVNFNNQNPIKIKDLHTIAAKTIFDFDYPLSSHVDKAYFEKMILNHFLMRRINFDTVNLFKINLDIKLNEIMPKYNQLFDSIYDWNLFDGEVTSRKWTETGSNTNTASEEMHNQINDNYNATHTFVDVENYTKDIKSTVTDTSTKTVDKTDSTIIKEETTQNDTTHSDSTAATQTELQHSDTPQQLLENVKEGAYLTTYDYNTENQTGTNNASLDSTINKSGSNNLKSDSTENNDNKSDTVGHDYLSDTHHGDGTDYSTNSSNNNGTKSSNENGGYGKDITETFNKTNGNKLELILQMSAEYTNIFTQIFNDLEPLFFGQLIF